MPDDIAVLRPRLEEALDRAIAGRAFPGAAVHMEWRGQVLVVARGRLGYQEPFEREVDESTIYDLASLTKLWTLSAALLTMRESKIDPRTPLCELLPEFGVPDKRPITLRHLMQHSSGISFAVQAMAPWAGNGSHPQRSPVPREQWVARIASEPLAHGVGERVLYSCTNYFLLARALEMDGYGGPLKALIEDGRRLHAPGSSLSLHPAALPEKWIAPTEVDPSTGEALRGVVHDEAARFWSRPEFSFAGNAGMFGDIRAVAAFVSLWLGDGFFHPDDVRDAFADTLPENADGDPNGARRGWGWQIDNPLMCGRIGADVPRGSFGHGGFTGTGLWAHRPTQSACVLLSNRVYPTRNGPNRFPFHREVSSLLGRFVAEREPQFFDPA